MQVTLLTTTGEANGKVELPAALFAREGSKRVLQEVIIAYQANQRAGTSDTKTRAEVSGGGRKPWKQKGTGNARSGSNRSPLWRKGGITFGPHPRSYYIPVGEEKKRIALATALKLKAEGQEISIVESLPEGEGKTGAMGKFFTASAPQGRVLVVVDKKTDLLDRAIRNIRRVSVVDARGLNPWALLHAQKVFVTKLGLKALESRFPQG